VKKTLILALFIIGFAAEAEGRPVQSIRLVLPPQTSPAVENVQRILARYVQERCDAKVVTTGEAPLTVEFAVEPGIGAEGFKIADGPQGAIRIIGNDHRGLLYGVGKFLHTSAYGSQGITPSAWRGVSVPKMPVRGIYFATHFHNYYQDAPVEDVARYLEDLSLWGVNGVLVWFGMEDFNGIDDPEAQVVLARLRTLLKLAKDLGMDASLGCVANQGYKNSPQELRATMIVGDLGTELCPSKPGVLALELKSCQEKFNAFKDIGLDYWFIAPYDNGGCGCPQCAPWGINGYMRLAEPEARAYRRAFPKGKVILSTWNFDLLFGRGEWVGLTEKFKKQKPDWVDYIMADEGISCVYPRYPLDKGVPGGLPLLNFPEISMWNQGPWGGYGANPFPNRLQQRWNEIKEKMSGGFPYSEGIYEDLNEVIVAQQYWKPDRPAEETIREYSACEFSPEAADDVVEAVKIFEKNHLREQIDSSALTAYRLMERADAKLTPQARRSWRWRILYLRATIDQEIYKNRFGLAKDEVFEQSRQELVKIYHAEMAVRDLQPARIRAVDLIGMDLSADYAKAVMASKPAAWWRMIPPRHDQADVMEMRDHRVDDATGNKVMATCDGNVAVGMLPATDAKASDGRAAALTGGRLKATVEKLGDNYSVELWFYHTTPRTSQAQIAYLFSRGKEGSTNNLSPGDNLGIGGAFQGALPGRLFFYSRIREGVDLLAAGKTELLPKTWNHVVIVREGKQVKVFLNGNAAPDVSAEMEKGYPDGAAQLFLGGRNDNFANFQGKIAEISVYDRALTGDEAVGHYQAAGLSRPDILRPEPKTNTAEVKCVQTIRVRFLAERSDFRDIIFSIFRRQVQNRCAAVVKLSGAGELNVELAISGDIGKEGFRIEDGAGGAIRITGNDDLGLLYGVGKFLRTSRYDQGGFTPGSWRGTSVPECPLRAIYFATHFGNWYQLAPQEEIEHYLEDMVLWGFNTWAFTFPVDAYGDFNEPAARNHIKQLRGLMAAAKRLHLKVGIGNAINNALKTVPKNIAGQFPTPQYHRNPGIVACPSLPEGHDYILDIWRQTMAPFADIGGGIDYIWGCAYDTGGCGCEKCRPWGANGFLRITKDVMAQEKAKNPDCKLVLSTWGFDDEEWKGLVAAMAKDKSWVDYLMLGQYPNFPKEFGIPGNLPMANFPEISMWGMNPWGGYGANPQPSRIQNSWKGEAGSLSGGLPYSEGVYEDINKAIYSQLYWKKDRNVEDIVREYIAFEYSPKPKVVDDVLAAINILESSLSTLFNDPKRDKLSESDCHAFDLLKKADAKLTLQAQNSWRWRILYLRAMIDCEMFKNGGKLEGAVLKKALDELREIYYADRKTTEEVLQPPKMP
jgi:hypothetical protein